LQPQLPQHDHLAVADPQVHKRRGTLAVHDHGHGELSRELAGRRKMVGVRVRIDQVADTQAVARGERYVVIDLADFRIDQRGRAGVGAADEVGLTAAGRDLLE
jgi:hypothetical protein